MVMGIALGEELESKLAGEPPDPPFSGTLTVIPLISTIFSVASPFSV